MNFKRHLFFILLLLTTSKLQAQTLLGIDFTPLSNKSVEFILTFDREVSTPIINDDNQPARIILDFKNTKLGLQKTSYPLNFDNLNDVLFQNFKNTTRMLINLERLERYQVGIEKKRLFVIIGVPDGSSSDFFINSDGNKIHAIKTGRYVPTYGGKFKNKPINRIDKKETEADILWKQKSNESVEKQPAKIGSLKKGKRILNKNAPKPDAGIPTLGRPETEKVPEWDVKFEGFDTTTDQASKKRSTDYKRESIVLPKPQVSKPNTYNNQLIPQINDLSRNYNQPQSNNQSQSNKQPQQGFTKLNELSIVDFDFNTGEQNEAIVEIKFSNEDIDVDIQRHHRHVTFQFRNTKLPDDLKLRFDVADFKTIANLIDLDTKNLDAIITIEVNNDYDYFIYQSTTSYFIYLSESAFAPPSVRRGSNGLAYSGRQISLNLKNIDIAKAITQITDFVGVNAVISPSVNGNTSINLNNIEWNKALDSFLAINGLSSQWQNQTLFIAPTKELAILLQSQPKSLISKLLPIQYADVSAIESIIKQSGLLSKQGKSVADVRTNTLLLNDYDQNIDEITSIISTLDIASEQVSIEARLVVVNTAYRKLLGINWSDAINLHLEASHTNLLQPVNLSLLSDTQLLDIELNAMESQGQGEVISKPKIITVNNQHASIRSGQEFAIFNRDNDGNNTNTTFKQALLSLDVTPQITHDDNVLLKLSIAQDALSGFNDGIPIIDITNLDTTVSVGSGETIVLGGLYQTTDSNEVEKVPYFNRIPLLGKLFKRKFDNKTKQEVLVFITPTILPANPVNNVVSLVY